MVNMNGYTFTSNNNKSSYAHIVKENPLQKVASSVQIHASNAANIGKAITKAEGSDYTLGRMNDTTIRMGSLGIATLASSLAFSKVSGINEFIGFACWFASMGLSPKIINKMVQVKYGLDLDKEYVDSYGRRKKVFEDPGFICWDLMPKEEIDKIGDKMGIPKNIVNRREAIHEKITQVVVQSKTWSMLSAGIATPVVASLLADGINLVRPKLANFFHAKNIANIESSVEKALQSGNIEKAQKILAKAVDNTFGMKEGSAIARMWQSTPTQVVKKTGIIDGAVQKLGEVFKNAKKVITGRTAWIPKFSTKVSPASEADKIKAIAEYLTGNANKAKEGVNVLNNSINTTKSWSEKLLGVMKAHPELHDDAMEQFIKLRTANLESGFGNVKNVLEQAAKKDPAYISKLLKGISDAGARRQLLENLKPERVLEYLGKNPRNTELVKEVTELFKAGKTEKALDLLSKRPVKFIDEAVSNTLLHQRWLKRIGGIAIGLVAATAIYTFFLMGHANKFNPEIKK